MSAEDGSEDKAKDRAEERAERELQLKIDTLELERDKFRYARVQSVADRISTAAIRGTTALLFANGSTFLLGITSYKSFLDVLGKPALERSLRFLAAGFITATFAFVCALILSVYLSLRAKQTDRAWIFYAYVCITFSMASLAALGLAFLPPIVLLRSP